MTYPVDGCGRRTRRPDRAHRCDRRPARRGPARHPRDERPGVRDAAGRVLQSHRLRRPHGREPLRLGRGPDGRGSEVHDDLLDALRRGHRPDGRAGRGARRCPPGALPPHGVAAGHRPAPCASALGRRHPLPLRGLRDAGLPAAPPAAGAAAGDRGGAARGRLGVLHRLGAVAPVLAGAGARRVDDRHVAADAGDDRRGTGRLSRRLARPAARPVGGGAPCSRRSCSSRGACGAPAG